MFQVGQSTELPLSVSKTSRVAMNTDRRWARLSRCALLLLAIPAIAQITDEYYVKAAFLYNFARFVEWPPGTFHKPEDRFAICVLGEDPFGRALEDTIAGKTLEGRLFRVARIRDAAHAAGCQILFIGSSEQKQLAEIVSALPATGILTVGEMRGFATSGGIINFVLNDGRVRFQINRRPAAKANLQISSRLLSLAEIVDK
ncbi:MAG: YfiR family protein [Bryobacteraceae bacterium]